MAASDFDTALRSFHSVLHNGDEARHDINYTRRVIQSLAFMESEPLFFLRLIQQKTYDIKQKFLQHGTIDGAGNLVIEGERGARNIIRPDAIGKGAFGQVFRSDKFAYKRIKVTGNHVDERGRSSYNPDKLNYEIRIAFLEAWIQTVLGSDTTHGKNICRINAIFVEDNIYPTFNFENGITFLIQMNVLGDSVIDYMTSAGEKTVELIDIKPLLTQLTESLMYFNDKYGFVHRDLHSGNVMFNYRLVTIIDFGMSCITLNGITYADPSRFRKQGCWSFDMYTFLSSLLQGSHSKAEGIRIPGNTMSDQCYGRIKNMFQTPSINLYDYALDAVVTKGIRLPSHVFYPNNIDDLGITRYIPEYSKPRRSLAHLEHIHDEITVSRLIDRAQLAAIRVERETIIANAKAKLAAKIAANLAAAGLPARAPAPSGLHYRAGGAGGAGGLPVMGGMDFVPAGKKAKAEPACCKCLAGMFGCCPCLGGSRKKTNRKRQTGRRQRATRRRR